MGYGGSGTDCFSVGPMHHHHTPSHPRQKTCYVDSFPQSTVPARGVLWHGLSMRDTPERHPHILSKLFISWSEEKSSTENLQKSRLSFFVSWTAFLPGDFYIPLVLLSNGCWAASESSYCWPAYVTVLLPVACIPISQTKLPTKFDLLSLNQIYLWVSII